ncbi:MAG: 30S ribosomal protein S3 [Oscillospiraceae bacterium]|jgi:small subunit ribosomal protein S3|nr:30S ribosomal protein S3 [Oscillospiraceae bacterium]
MGQKVNPHGLRVGVITDWDSRWFANKAEFGDTLVEDYKIREILKKKLKDTGIPKIEIERFGGEKVRINIHCARPGIAIGKGGETIDKLKAQLEKMTKKTVYLNILEVKNTDTNAQLVAEKVAKDLEERVSFRRATKQAISRSMKAGAKGIKTMVSGRLGGAEIARSETYKEGTIPLQTIRADIDYGFAEADTTYGKIGVKIWIYKGEVLKGEKGARVPEQPQRPNNGFRKGGGRGQGGQGGQGGRGGQGGQGRGGYGNRSQGNTRYQNGQGGQGGGQGGQGGNRPAQARPQYNNRPRPQADTTPALAQQTVKEGGNE